MSTTVTLSIFSGRTNPRYTLTGEQEYELHNLFSGLKRRVGQRVVNANTHGFANFRVIKEVGKKRSDFICGAGLVEFPSMPYSFKDTTGVAFFLLNACPPDLISASLRNELSAFIKEPPPPKQKKVARKEKCAASLCPDAPPFDPNWAKAGFPGVVGMIDKVPCNNCYDYANNRMTHTYSQPGYASGLIFTEYSCRLDRPDSVAAAAVRDGLKKVNNITTPLLKKQGWYVALFLGKVKDMHDFHWLRVYNSGCWCHKLADNFASNRDGTFHFITDPRAATLVYAGGLVSYKNFCGFFITNKAVTIKGMYDPIWDCYDPGW